MAPTGANSSRVDQRLKGDYDGVTGDGAGALRDRISFYPEISAH
jgi:hypothetical protein